MQRSEVWILLASRSARLSWKHPGSLSLALRIVGNFPLYSSEGEQQQCNRSKDPMHVSMKVSHCGTCRELTPAFAYIAREHRTINPLKQFLGPSGLGFLFFCLFYFSIDFELGKNCLHYYKSLGKNMSFLCFVIHVVIEA